MPRIFPVSALLCALVPTFLSDPAFAIQGGRAATRGEFPGVVFFDRPMCTGAKIGPRHYLTAAHCFTVIARDRQEPNFKVGDRITIHAGSEPPYDFNSSMTIKTVHFHPSWKQAMEKFAIPLEAKTTDSIVDAAILETEERADSVPEAKIDAKPISNDDVIWLTGFGKTIQLVGERSKVLKVTSKKVSQHQRLYVELPAQDANASTRSQAAEGDSGGPVFRKLGDGSTRIVGTIALLNGSLYLAEEGGATDFSYIHTGVARIDAPWVLSALGLQSESSQPIQFVSEDACSGFDDTGAQPWLMVPLGGSKTLSVRAQGPVTIQTKGVNASLSNGALTISADHLSDWGAVKLCLVSDASSCQTVYVSVKPRIEKTLLVHHVKAKNVRPAAQTVEAKKLEAYFERVFGQQANVHIRVELRETAVDFDKDGDGYLRKDNLFDDLAPLSEEERILASAADSRYDMNAFLVPDLDRGQAYSFDQIVIKGDHHRNSSENILAHEVGHLLGLMRPRFKHHESRDNLMFADSLETNPCRLVRSQWDGINPALALSKNP